MWYTMKILFAFFLLVQLICGESKVPCYFIFGDSLVDNGNNNFLNTTVKVNYPPYGIDYSLGATGRFTNGRNLADLIAEFLGFSDHIPPFATAEGRHILKGVNYGSGGAGIRKETGQNFGNLISLDGQIKNHRTTIRKIGKMLGNASLAMEHLSKCIYTVGMGSNDYFNYFSENTKKYSPTQYTRVLMDQYCNQLRTLYNIGARKVAIFGLGPIGCTPAERKKHNYWSTCATRVNNVVRIFNKRLKPMVDDLNRDLAGAKFIYVDTLSISSSDPATNSFKFLNSTCCKVSSATGLCIPHQVACNPRTDFTFFDSFHPTEASNMIIARRAYRAQSTSDAYPSDIYHLAQVR